MKHFLVREGRVVLSHRIRLSNCTVWGMHIRRVSCVPLFMLLQQYS